MNIKNALRNLRFVSRPKVDIEEQLKVLNVAVHQLRKEILMERTSFQATQYKFDDLDRHMSMAESILKHVKIIQENHGETLKLFHTTFDDVYGQIDVINSNMEEVQKELGL